MFVHFMIYSYPSHNQEQTHQVASEVASFATCEKQCSNVPHIEFFTCHKIVNMPNLKLLFETENEETENELAC